MNDLFPFSADQLALWPLNVLIHATIVTVVSLAVARVYRKQAAMRYWVLCFGLLLLMATPVASALIQVSGGGWLTLSLVPETVSNRPAVQPPHESGTRQSMRSDQEHPNRETGGADANIMLPQPRSLEGTERSASLVASAGPINSDSGDQLASPQAEVADWPAGTPGLPLQSILRWIGFPLACVWLSGACLLCARMLVGWWGMAKILRQANPISSQSLGNAFECVWQTMDRSVIGKKRPELLVSDQVSGPIAAGVFRGKVVLPQSLVDRVDVAALRDVLIHEAAHLARGDHVIILLQNFVSAIFWLHPLVRVLNHQLAKAREEVCDNFVLASTDARSYSRTLLAVAELVSRREAAVVGAVGFFTSRWRLEQRVADLLDTGRDRRTALSTKSWLLVVLTAASLSMLACMGTISIADARDDPAATIDAADASEEVSPSGNSDITSDNALQLKGRVVGPQGRPKKAKLWIGGPPRSEKWRSQPLNVQWQSVGQANDDGRFEISLREELRDNIPDEQKGTYVRLAATAPGFGFAWADVDLNQPIQPLALRLVDDTPIEGRIVTVEGQPAEGVRLSIVSVVAPDALPDSETMIANATFSSGIYTNWPAWRGGSPTTRLIVTDAQGRFRLSGLGAERSVRLEAEGGGIGAMRLSVKTRPAPQHANNGVIAIRRGLRESSYFANFTHIAVPGRVIRGLVKDKATGQPIGGVEVVAPRSWVSRSRPSVTDRRGRFGIDGVPKDETYELQLTPRDATYFRKRADVRDSISGDALDVVMPLTRGIKLRGRVIDKETGEGVSGRLEYCALFPNEHIDSIGDQPVATPLSRTQTRSDGSFEIGVLPGPGALGVRVSDTGYPDTGYPDTKYARAWVDGKKLRRLFRGARLEARRNELGQYDYLPIAVGGQIRGIGMSVSGYQGFELLDVSRDDPPEYLTMELIRSPWRAGVVFDAEGKPLAGVEIIGLGPKDVSVTRAPLETHEFTIGGLLPGRKRNLLCLHRERSLGAKIVVDGSDSEPVQVELSRTGTVLGRFIDSVGDPYSDIELELMPDDPPIADSFFWLPEVGKNGRFRITHLIPGVRYSLHAHIPGHRGLKFVRGDIVVKPGGSLDLGAFKLTDENEFVKAESDDLP